jgi:LytS/YehU family sensor histidine kinase
MSETNAKMPPILRGGHGTFLAVTIDNSIPQKKKIVHSTGIGLENVQQRLLRLYTHRHTLKITPTATTFSIHLEIKLNS